MSDAVQGDKAPNVERLLAAVATAIGLEAAGHWRESAGEADSPAERAAARVRFVEAHRQANIETIVRFAAEEIGADSGQASVEPAWLLRFFDRVRDADAELEQRTWARLLAREIEAPGAFGKRTLDFLAAMDPWELEGFIEYCAFAFSFESGWRFMFEGEAAQREMWAYGRELDLGQHFIGMGLLANETGFMKRSSRGLRVRYQDRIYELQPAALGDGDADCGNEGRFAYRKFTAIGQQISEVVRSKTFFGYARNLIKALNANGGSMAFELVEPLVDS
jgi:hypothetical protein